MKSVTCEAWPSVVIYCTLPKLLAYYALASSVDNRSVASVAQCLEEF
ncbi:MAG: hypothetical protein RH917_00525 [Lacipirellulaceae bacterium]